MFIDTFLVSSYRYLSVQNSRADLNRTSFKVKLTDGDEGCWLKILPSFKAPIQHSPQP